MMRSPDSPRRCMRKIVRSDGPRVDEAGSTSDAGRDSGPPSEDVAPTPDGSRHRTTAITAKDAAFRRNARVKPPAAISSPPIAGPMMKARLSSVAQALLAGPSSVSSRTITGR